MTGAVPHVYLAIHEIQAKLSKSGIPKSERNPQQGYNFRGIDNVYEHLAPLLAEHKLLILPSDKESSETQWESQKGGTLFKTRIKVEYTFLSVKDGSKHVVESEGEAMDSGDKATNKAKSAAYKTMAIQAFSIKTGEGNDTENHSYEVAGRGQSAKPRIQSQRPQGGGETRPPCPACGCVEATIDSRMKPGYWHCFKKKGGCGNDWSKAGRPEPEPEWNPEEDPDVEAIFGGVEQ